MIAGKVRGGGMMLISKYGSLLKNPIYFERFYYLRVTISLSVQYSQVDASISDVITSYSLKLFQPYGLFLFQERYGVWLFKRTRLNE